MTWTQRTLAVAFLTFALPAFAQQKPRFTFDEFFSATSLDSIAISPDGKAVAVATSRADWPSSRWRQDIWLATAGASPRLLTQSGHDFSPKWSPDGRLIAFLSDRAVEALPDECPPDIVNNADEEECESESQEKQRPSVRPEPERPTPDKPKAFGRGRDASDDEEEEKDKEIAQLYVLSIDGGEPIVVTAGREEVHAFDWSPDSKTLYVARRITWTPKQREDHKKRWKTAERFREDERGDEVLAFKVEDAIARARTLPPAATKQTSPVPAETISERIAVNKLAISELEASPDGKSVAFVTSPVSARVENPSDYEIFIAAAHGSGVTQLTKNVGLESDIRWSPDSKRLFFSVGLGSVEGAYTDPQSRIYAVDANSGTITRYAARFAGAVQDPEAAPDGSVVALGRIGTQVGVYAQRDPQGEFALQSAPGGTVEHISVASATPAIAAVFSSAQQPPEVYLADSLAGLKGAKPITNFNQLFTQRQLPEYKTFKWTSTDGTPVEGVLLYPPGQAGAKHLKMFTFIHGGPADADGDHFGADWYDWGALAASEGWLVFRPNYRGSTGYGDKFQLDIAPNLVSVPGRDILTGVEALVKEGIADPDRLVIGGYSYGGYMTNWLITQTTRFKAAVTGAGAVEHVANWGNDDLTHDDAWYLGGLPWEQPQRYNDEAAIWQINKVKTPTHMVVGGDDVRVAALESYLLERALHKLNVPSSLLILPGEGHSLKENPWHGYIKVREELRWLNKYVPEKSGKEGSAD